MSEKQDGEHAPERNGNITARLEQLERAMGEQSARLRLIEGHLGIAAIPAAHSSKEPRAFGQGTAAPPVAAEPDAPTPSRASRDWSANVPPAADESVRDRRSGESARQVPPRERRVVVAPPLVSENAAASGERKTAETVELGGRSWLDLEASIGGSWFNWIGIIALTLGVGFFLKYAFENQWIGPTGRVLLGGATGCSLLALAERIRMRGYRSYAYVLSGGGILILYLSIYAAYNSYQLIGQSLAFLSMAAVTTIAVLLAARDDALPVAILGLIGGFMTPILLSRGVDNQLALFGYIALLDAGVLALAYFKNWRSLDYLSFAATVLMFAGWMVSWYTTEKLWPTVFFLTLFFVMFSALAILHNVLRRRPSQWLDISLIITNATLYFATSYGLLESEQHHLLGAHALVVAVFFALLFFAADRLHRADQLLALSYLGAGVTFVTLAVALQLDQHWATIGWAVESLLLTWIGFRAERNAPRYAALPVLLVACLHWLGADVPASTFREGVTFWPLFNAHAVSCYALVAACVCAAQLYRRRGEKLDKREREIFGAVFILAANALALALLTIDVDSYFRQLQARAGVEAVAPLENWKQFVISLLWTSYATLALIVGLRKKSRYVRYAALGLLAVAGVKILLVDAGYYNALWHVPLFNQTFVAFALYTTALACVYFLYSREKAQIEAAEREAVTTAIIIVANVFAIIALSLEAVGHFAKLMRLSGAIADERRDLRLAQQLSLSVIWAVYGGALLVFGLMRRNQLLRVMALLLLGITILKVFFLDLSSLDRIYRIISFIVLGAILLVVSFLYQQRQQRATRGV